MIPSPVWCALEATLTQVLQNMAAASAQLLDMQLDPECELKTLAAHTRAVSAQAAALKTLTVLLGQLTDPQNALLTLPAPAEMSAGSASPLPDESRNAARDAVPPEKNKNNSPPPRAAQPAAPQAPSPTVRIPVTAGRPAPLPLTGVSLFPAPQPAGLR